jgi:hypothetical protein
MSEIRKCNRHGDDNQVECRRISDDPLPQICGALTQPQNSFQSTEGCDSSVNQLGG